MLAVIVNVIGIVVTIVNTIVAVISIIRDSDKDNEQQKSNRRR
jgi:hypothetical protein